MQDVPWPTEYAWAGHIRPLDPSPRWGPPSLGLRAQVFITETVDVLCSPRALLDDDVINGCAALLKRYVIENRMPHVRAILLSCYEIRRLQEGSPPSYLWRQFQHAYDQVSSAMYPCTGRTHVIHRYYTRTEVGLKRSLRSTNISGSFLFIEIVACTGHSPSSTSGRGSSITTIVSLFDVILQTISRYARML